MNFRHHVFFWTTILVIMTLIFGGGNSNYTESFYFACMLVPVAIGTSWYFNMILVPQYLIPGRYFKFGLCFVYSMIISLWLQMIVTTVSLIILAQYDIEKMNPLTTNVLMLGISIYLVVFVQAFIQMFSEMNKVKQVAASLKEDSDKRSSGYILIKSDRKNHKLILDDILYIESQADYLRIRSSSNKTITTRETISRMEERLPSDFIRIHRSFIVARNKITSFNKEEVIIEDQRLPLSRKYKTALMTAMNPTTSGI